MTCRDVGPALTAFLSVLLVLVGISAQVFARGSAHSTGRSSVYHSLHSSQRGVGVARDKNGHIARSSTARQQFMKQHPCPSTGKTSGACPGYVVDHIQALKHGGKDEPSNMQWQTIQAAKDKDRWE
jgi:hypothetical protein